METSGTTFVVQILFEAKDQIIEKHRRKIKLKKLLNISMTTENSIIHSFKGHIEEEH